ncbi:MAG TPA: hypothetical protein VFE62_08810 [Gemmataceae bacterium]|nr:hypothetical protein [Gemmataceae bacterium]
MQRWLMAMGAAGLLAGAASAQVQVQVQGKVVQAAQVQVLPANKVVVADRVALLPAMVQGVRLTQADAIFVGRVIAIEPMDVEAAPAQGQGKVKYRVAVVQVSDNIFGLKKDAQNVRLAFVVQGNGNFQPGAVGGAIQIQPAIQPVPGGPMIGRRPYMPFGQMNLTVGQEGMFAVNKHSKENFYLSPTPNNFVVRQNNGQFDNQVKSAKQLAKVMGNPVAALKSDDHQERYTAAAVLITKYRVPNNPTGAALKQEKIDAEESKLILKALAGGDWKNFTYNAPIPSPHELFNLIGINQNDGYRPVNLRTQQDIAQAMQKWIDENTDKYRISRQVVDPNGKAPVVQPVPQPGGIQVQPGVIRGGIRIQPLPAPVPQQLPANPAPQDR